MFQITQTDMSKIRSLIDGRTYEWAVSLPITVLGFMLLTWPQITTAPAFRLFSWAMPSNLIAVSFLICGIACITALLVNGASLEIGPRVRSWMALSRAVLFFQFGLSTLQAGFEQGYPYTVTPFWFSFSLAELWIAYRAVLDVRTHH